MSYEFKQYLKSKDHENNIDPNKKDKIIKKIQNEIDELRAQYKINKKHTNTNHDKNIQKDADDYFEDDSSQIIDKPLQMSTKKNMLEDENSLLISDRKEITSYVDEKPYEIFDKAKSNLMKLKNDLVELDQYNLSRMRHDEYY